ncbi:MAG: DUF5661 family protein [Bacteroidota bacterium]
MNKRELERGTKVEMEHAATIKKYMRPGVSIKEVAKSIAADHLKESPTYYKQLDKIEGNFEKAKIYDKKYNKPKKK